MVEWKPSKGWRMLAPLETRILTETHHKLWRHCALRAFPTDKLRTCAECRRDYAYTALDSLGFEGTVCHWHLGQ